MTGPRWADAAWPDLREALAARGYPLVPGHDPVVWPVLTRDTAARSGRLPAR